MIFVNLFRISALLTFCLVCGQDVVYKTVETDKGSVRGIQRETLVHKRKFYSFKGIPYAKPPVGKLRFKPPLPAESWRPNKIDALEYGPACYQSSNVSEFNPTQSEDCLFLNIFVPADVTHEKFVTMFFLYGGSFTEGYASDDIYGPDNLIDNGVIFVTINYRVGFFGFMTLGNCEYSGNMGLKDQQLALKWLNKNIENFGGDKNKITLIGQSAGSASTNYHVLNPKSRKYFQRAICMSSSVFDYYTLAENSSDLCAMYDLAKELNKPQSNYAGLVKFLIEAPAQDLANKTFQPGIGSEIYGTNLIPYWRPCIEKCKGKGTFLPESPEKLYKKNNIDIDIMFGVTYFEYLVFVIGAVNDPTQLESLNSNFNISVPFRGFNLPFESKPYQILRKKMKKFYFGDGPIGAESLYSYLKFLTYLNFEYGITKAVKIHAARSCRRTYYYRFAAIAKLNLYRALAGLTAPYSTHGDDNGYILKAGFMDAIYEGVIATKDTDAASALAYRLLTDLPRMFANFAKTGKPTIDGYPPNLFKPARENKIHYLNITNDGYFPRMNPRESDYRFWHNLEELADDFVQRERSKKKKYLSKSKKCDKRNIC